MITQKSKEQNQNKHSNLVKLANWIIKWRWGVVAVSLLTTIIIGYGAQYVGFNSDYRVFFSDENPQLNAFDALQDKYTKDDNILIVIEPLDGDIFTVETLSAIEKLTQDSWQTPHSSRVDGIANFQYTRAEEDDLFVEDLIENSINKTPLELAEIKKIAINEPLLKNRLIDEKGKVTAINITLKLPDNQPLAQDASVAFVKKISSQFEADNPRLKTYLSGSALLTGAFKEAAEYDMSTWTPAMFLIIILTILFATRSFSSTIGTLAVIVFSLVTAMGFAGWMGIKLTAPSSAFINIVMTLAIADSIHVLISIIQQMRKGLDKKQAIIESVRVNFMPVFITSLTTVIGFLSMNFSDSPPFHDLGNITSVGMVAAFVFSIFMLPALMAILPLKVSVKENKKTNQKSSIEKFGDWVVERHRPLAWISAAIVIAVSAFAIQNELNDEFVKYFSDDIQFRADTDAISEKLTGIYNTEFSLGTGEAGGINNPAYLAKLEEFKDYLNEQPEVIHVNTFSEIAKRVNKSMHGDSLKYYNVPTNREEAAQYLLLYEMSLPFGLDLNNQINVDKSETRMTVTLDNLSSNDLIAFNQRAENWLDKNAPKEMFANAISTTTMFAHLGKRQLKSMMNGTTLAIFLISIVLMIALRSFRYGSLSLIPNITPVAVGFGVWAMTVGTINTGISVVFGMTLGIIVDDTVHFVSKYLRARREQGKSPEDAVRYAFSTVGQALVVTTLVLMAGFFVLGQSSFAMNNGMARLTVIIMALALAIDFFLLPGLLIFLGKMQDRRANNKSGYQREASINTSTQKVAFQKS